MHLRLEKEAGGQPSLDQGAQASAPGTDGLRWMVVATPPVLPEVGGLAGNHSSLEMEEIVSE